MQVVKIRSETESLDRAIDVRLDMALFVGYSTVFEAGHAALGRNYIASTCQLLAKTISCRKYARKILSRTLCFLMKSPRSFSFTPAA